MPGATHTSAWVTVGSAPSLGAHTASSPSQRVDKATRRCAADALPRAPCSTQAENTTAARGRIMDADFATETANLSRSQILQQAGTAMVAQANQLPQQVLQLLK